MNLPARIPKKAKRSTRWRSQAHLSFVRKHACSNCGSMCAIEAAHVRLGSHTGMGQKPDDFRAVSLCKECHQRQHTGEETFWKGRDVEALIRAFVQASPRRREIEDVMRERGL
jgi:transposase